MKTQIYTRKLQRANVNDFAPQLLCIYSYVAGKLMVSR